MGYYKRVQELKWLRAKTDRLHAHNKRMDKYASPARPDSDVEEGGPVCFHPHEEDLHMSILNRVFGAVKTPSGDCAAEDAQMSRDYPGITELMTATPSVGKGRRETSTLTVVCEDMQWKVGLRDRTNQVSLWRSGKTLTEALHSLEDALQGDNVDWRRTGDPKARARQ